MQCTDDFFDSVRLSLSGISPGAELKRDCLRKSAVASAFEEGSTAVAVDLGPGLWTILRSSADGLNRVLCVHNATQERQVFEPATHLGDGAPVFLGGETTSSANEGRLECELGPHGFVWIGRLGSSTARTSE
ncbi:hypothetical protein [Lentzea sp. NPDC059081]|uniref:hypothetical protein n=1 Tax=Lentzea sp. NPDC059081 TaxID=3346719 RepID=UPI00369B5AFD